MSSISKIEIPLIEATNQSLKGYGYLVDNFDQCEIEIVTWPKQGWRNIAVSYTHLTLPTILLV